VSLRCGRQGRVEFVSVVEELVLVEMGQAPDCPDAIEALIELFNHDERPTLILDSLHEGIRPEWKYHINYRNPALEEFLSDHQEDASNDTILRQWTNHFEQLEKQDVHHASTDWEVDGLAWRTTTLGTRWKVTHLRRMLTEESTARYTAGNSLDYAAFTGDEPFPTSPTSATFENVVQFNTRPIKSEDEKSYGRKRKRLLVSRPSENFEKPPEKEIHTTDVPNPNTENLTDGVEEAELTGNLFKELVEHAAVGCAIYRPDGRPIFLNEAYLKLTGMSRDDFRPGMWQQAIVPDDLVKVEERWTQLSSGRSTEPFEFRVKRSSKTSLKKDGSEAMEFRWLLSNGQPDLNPDGTCRTVMGWLTDISYQKWSEHLQAERLEDALENKRQTEKFIDMVSQASCILR
jgi:PAS domain S-box-containing protein